MAEAISPRTYLVGRILPVLLRKQFDLVARGRQALDVDDIVKEAIRIADLTLERMQWPGGKPTATGGVESGRHY